jgi:hypothetical protein
MNNINKVSIFELYEIKKRKELKISKVFNYILDIINKKIKLIAEQGGMCLYYKIPRMIIGYPLYDYNSCFEYIMKQLKQSGLFVIKMPNPNNEYIYVSWKSEDLSDKVKSRLLLE